MVLPQDLLSKSYTKPKVILCQTNKENICQLDATELSGTFKFNSYSEISFNVASVYQDLITGETKPTPYYDYIDGLRLVYLEGFGYFQLQNPELYSDGIKEYKSINAYSLEYVLSQRYLENFIINKGDVGDTIGSIDGVVLYNPNDSTHSLLHLVLQKAYGWTIGHVDDELANQSRSFEVDRESIYDFLMNEMCETFKCYIEFDTINNTVNVYSENEIERLIGDGVKASFQLTKGISDTSEVTINGHVISQYSYDSETKIISFITAPSSGDIIEVTDNFKSKYDTDVFVTFENLSNEMKVNYSADDIKTVLTVKGADDLDIRNVNFGLPSIMNLDYYCTPEWMGDKLCREYEAYIDKQDKYMSGFYSKDVSGVSEETINVVADIRNFNAGTTQEFTATDVQESFNVDGDKSILNIDKKQVEFNVDSSIEEYDVNGDISTFKEPMISTEEILCEDPSREDITVREYSHTFTYDGINKVFNLPKEFVFNENSVVKIRGIEVNDYIYNEEDNSITYNGVLVVGDKIVVSTYEDTFDITSIINSLSVVQLNGTPLETSEYEYLNKKLKINVELKDLDKISIYTYKNVFQLKNPISSDSVVYLNGSSTISYSYNSVTKELTINQRLSSSDTIKIDTPSGKIQTDFSLKNLKYKVVSVKVDGMSTSAYSIDGGTLTITDISILKYGSTITIEEVNTKFSLNNVKDKIICVKINDNKTSKYSITDGILEITSNDLHTGDTVSVESIEAHFDLSQYKNMSIVSVNINGQQISSYTFDKNTGVLEIKNYTFKPNNNISVKLVNNEFVVPQKKNEILSVKIDSTEISEYDVADTSIIIHSLNDLFNGQQVVVESVDDYFVLSNTNGIILSVKVDGHNVKFKYQDNKLYITSEYLKSNSNIVVTSIDNKFYIGSLNGAIESVIVGDNVIDESSYTFDTNNNILTINSSSLKQSNKVTLKTIVNKFSITGVDNKVLTSIKLNGKIIDSSKYTFESGILTVLDNLCADDILSVEFIDNHFVIKNDIGSRHSVEKSVGDSFETIQEGSGYEYNDVTKTLTIKVPLSNGDEIKVKNYDSVNVLKVVDSDAGDGQILTKDVVPTLKSYVPKNGDYVIKIEGYTDVLKSLYELIDKRLTEENSVPDEYKITERILTPENFDESNSYLPEANIKNLGEVYKIINQDSNGNDVSYKYYVCEMKMSTYKDDDGKQQQKYQYLWNERNLVFGGEGINSLKEKIDIYSSINDIQVAAEWDKKPDNSDEKKSYKNNLNNLKKFKKELEIKEKEIGNIELDIEDVKNKILSISNDVNINKNFSPESLDRLSLFLREDEYTDDCFCITEIDTDLDIINTQKELLVSGYKKLKTISQPTLSFTASMKNIYAMPEFKPILNQFKLGNFIKVGIRKGFIQKARLIEIQFDFDDLSNFSCTFGDLLSAKSQGDLHADLLSQAVSAGKAVASGSSYWQKGYDVATAIEDKIRRGLIDATTSIKSNSAGQDVSWDNYGIHLRKVVDGVLDPHEGWITNNKFLYSDDNFETTKSVFGNYVIDGETYWGILAGCVSAGLIEGSKIIGGEICIGEREDGTYNFKVDKDGTVTMNKGDAAEKLSYFSFDGDKGLIVGENKDGEYFSRVSAQRIEFCRKAKITYVTSEPTHKYDNFDYIKYTHTEGSHTYFDYYKNPDFLYKLEEPKYEARAIDKDFEDPEIKFGIAITYFANNTAYMKQAEIEGNLKVGTDEQTPSISLGRFKLQIESNGSLSIVMT